MIEVFARKPEAPGNPALREWNEAGQLAGLNFLRTLN
jgi:hypothetical protein